MLEAVPRQLPSWIDSFIEYTNGLPSPVIFRRWCAISCIAGALERKVWIDSLGEPYYPTMYITLVGGPGVGKTIIVNRIGDLWRRLPDHHVAPNSLTAASLIDSLALANRSIVRPTSFPAHIQFNTLLLPVNELGVFLPEYDGRLLNTLTDIWDGKQYEERRRTNKTHLKLERPQIHLLAATTPSYLNTVMPSGAWEQGFMARVILIFSAENILVNPFGQASVDSKLYHLLQQDLKAISNMYGELDFTEEARDNLVNWHMSGGPPAPVHPRLQNYSARRTSHLSKLCIISAIDRGALQIELIDFQRALNWLLEAEVYMPDIFRAMGSGGEVRVIDETWFYVHQEFLRKGTPIQEQHIVAFISQRVPAHSVLRTLEVMDKAKILLKEIIPGQLYPVYRPGEKRY